MQTGENLQGLRKVLDFTRLLSLLLLFFHFYLSCHGLFRAVGWTSEITDRLMLQLASTGLFYPGLRAKLWALLLLAVSLLGVKGRKEEKLKKSTVLGFLVLGLTLYFGASLPAAALGNGLAAACAYMGLTVSGYLLLLTGGTLLSRLFRLRLLEDVFNTANETFPQEERLLENEYSINLPARYRLRNRVRDSWVNIINPFRALLVLGTPGAGKSYFVIRHAITQHIRKGFSMFIYDFKFDDLTRIAYNTLLSHSEAYAVRPRFYVINFDDLCRTHRCNPLSPEGMEDITDATEASRTIMLGLNREWIKKQGDFFVESPINFLTAIIWFLRKYEDGRFCTLPHVIELMQVDYDRLFPVLRTQREIEALINPFVSAFLNKAREQLEGQVASAKISLARLVSPPLYYVLSGNDFTLDLNNPEEPKVVCVGNNPQKLQVYGAVLSLYVSRVVKLVNRKGQLKSSLVFDEFPTIYFNGIDSLIATARSNRVATTLGVQDFSQLKKDYGRDQAEVILNTVGNIISGQVTGDTAKLLSERLGKILQERSSVSVNSADTSHSRSTQLDFAVPAAKISALSSGEFVGSVADNPEERITRKAFHCELQNDHAALQREEKGYHPLPTVRKVTAEDILCVYDNIREDIRGLVEAELLRLQPIGQQQPEAFSGEGSPPTDDTPLSF
jgi:hypothetical protein